ncbi:MAG: hypothetical protein ACK4GM_01550 [Tabrizicola sp.]
MAGAAHALAGTRGTLAVLRPGTFNWCARGKKMPENPEAAYARFGRYRVLADLASLCTILCFRTPCRMQI